MKREIAEGRDWTREEIRATRRGSAFLAEGEPYKVELVDTADGDISLYTQGDFTDLCRGPHLQNSAPIKAFKLTGLAGAYWRGDEHNTQLTRIYGTAFYSQADLDAYLERLEEARRRDHRRLGPQLDLFHLSEHSPGSPFWHPKGMVIWNELEDLRRRENRRRGYLEVKTPLLYDEETYVTSGHFENYEENIFWVQSHDESDRRFALKPMNCPGHMLLFGSPPAQLQRPAAALRRVVDPAPRREGRHAARPAARQARHPGRRAHLLPRRPDRGRDLRLPRLRRRTSTTCSSSTRASSSRRGPSNKLGTDEEWDFTEGALAPRSSGAGSSTRSTTATARSTGRRSTCT